MLLRNFAASVWAKYVVYGSRDLGTDAISPDHVGMMMKMKRSACYRSPRACADLKYFN
jgi:hypothetical protein